MITAILTYLQADEFAHYKLFKWGYACIYAIALLNSAHRTHSLAGLSLFLHSVVDT